MMNQTLSPEKSCRTSAAALTVAAPPTERILKVALAVCAALSVAITFGIIAVLFSETASFFGKVSPAAFFLDTEWTPLFSQKRFGIWALVSGTFLTSSIAMITALPLGILAAVFMSEFASLSLRAKLKPLLEILAGIPTVVYGFFALTYVTPLLQRIVPGLAGFNALSPGIVMGIMIVPIIASLSEDAIFAVPTAIREGAHALGAGKVRAIVRVILPTAFSGITAAAVLGVSRAIGETMIVAVAAGQQPRFTLNPLVPVETMTTYIVQVSLGDTPHGTIEYNTIFAVGAALFVATFFFNFLAFALRRRILKGRS